MPTSAFPSLPNVPLPPPQPPETSWRFVQDLQSPMWKRHAWAPRTARPNEADLSSGVRIEFRMPDPSGRLDTLWRDFQAFLAAGDVVFGAPDGYPIRIVSDSALRQEGWRREVRADECMIAAGDLEGVRRAVFAVEDEMLAAGGPFLPLGTVGAPVFVRRRISRCFFGPIKRPPKMRDELMDDVDYYPDEYLNRLAHDGVNGLWLSVTFRELCRTRWTPDGGRDAPRRIEKLRRTVDKCLRYGIRTYLFTIEPRAWTDQNPLPRDFPELGGHPLGAGSWCFCPSSPAGQQYLYETLYTIFRAVPDLGGLINISHGERQTTCLSALAATGEGRIRCPRCASKQPWEILYTALEPMARGMHEAAPEAEFIAWLYMPQARGPHRDDLADWVYEIPAHVPGGVILQFNYESGVRKDFFGVERIGGDYWLSVPGPADRFVRVASTAAGRGTPVSAKIQTGCSHEVATVPFVPVPGNIHAKFRGFRELGVRHTMLCWYFGNYPGIMNRAAGTASFDPFPHERRAFLETLARRDWGPDAPHVVRAWEQFERAYSNYPLSNLFQYYGPMHDGPVWPLLAEPTDAPLAPTWLLASPVTKQPYPPSGDRIGECFMYAFTLDEILELCRHMAEGWAVGVDILKSLEERHRNRPERLLDIGLAEALGIQFRSGWNILRFYALRERMFRMRTMERLDLLAEMARIVRDELRLDARMLELCRRDSRLGFHSEAEGYKYHPARIEWRMRQLKHLLERDMPALREAVERGDLLFPEYTGLRPTGPMVRCLPLPDTADSAHPADSATPDWQSAGRFRWTVCRAGDHMEWWIDGEQAPREVRIRFEPRRLWPCLHFVYTPDGAEGTTIEIPDRVAARRADGKIVDGPDGGRRMVVAIPYDHLHIEPDAGPVRMNLRVSAADGATAAWLPERPWPYRLRLGNDNPADLGWILL